MSAPNPNDVTLSTLHEDLTAGFGEMRAGFTDLRAEVRSGVTDLKTTLIAGFRGLASRESVEEIVRLLREANRLNEERFSQLDVRTREQSLEIQQVLHALAEGHRRLDESHRRLVEGQQRLDESHRRLTEEQRSLSAHLKALIDAMLGRRTDGQPPL
jgi:uncharacterized protein (DUF3084 family)